MLIGLLTNLILGGFKGLSDSLLATIVPFILLVILYALRMLGAGDIKLFCALGSIVGLKAIIHIMVYSFLSGGIIAVIFIILRKNAKERFLYIFRYFKYVFISLSPQPYTDFNDKSDKGKFSMAYAIASGVIIYIVFNFIGYGNNFMTFK